MRFPALWQAILNNEDKADDTALTRQFRRRLRLYASIINVVQSLKIVLGDQKDWRLGNIILHGDLSLLLTEFQGAQNSCHNSSIHWNTV